MTASLSVLVLAASCGGETASSTTVAPVPDNTRPPATAAVSSTLAVQKITTHSIPITGTTATLVPSPTPILVLPATPPLRCSIAFVSRRDGNSEIYVM